MSLVTEGLSSPTASSKSKIPRYTPLARRRSFNSSTAFQSSGSFSAMPPLDGEDDAAKVDDSVSSVGSLSTRSSMRLSGDSRIRVFLRVRPILSHESNENNVLSVDPAASVLTFKSGQSQQERSSNSSSSPAKNLSATSFQFDQIFGTASSNEDVYKGTVQSYLPSVLDGYNVTLLAYGQTGAGKTHTVLSPDGIVSRAVDEIFKCVHRETHRRSREIAEEIAKVRLSPAVVNRSSENLVDPLTTVNDVELGLEMYSLEVTFVQLYNEQIFDLLGSSENVTSLNLREHPTQGIYIEGLSSHKCFSSAQVLALLAKGTQRIVYAETFMNHHSSRAHTVFTLSVRNNVSIPSTTGKLSMYDLCGSERLKKSGSASDDTRLTEAKNINSSLACLSNCVFALADKAQYIPFRDSKLTRLLSESLNGNSKTCFIVCVSPASSNVGETVNTCRFAQRAKKVEMHPVVNVTVDYEKLSSKLQDDLEKMKSSQDSVLQEYAKILSTLKSSSSASRKTFELSNNPRDEEQFDLLKKQAADLKLQVGFLERENEQLKSELTSLGHEGVLRSVHLTSVHSLMTLVGASGKLLADAGELANLLLEMTLCERNGCADHAKLLSLQRRIDEAERASMHKLRLLMKPEQPAPVSPHASSDETVSENDVSLSDDSSADSDTISDSDDATSADSAGKCVGQEHDWKSLQCAARTIGTANVLYSLSLIAERNAMAEVIGMKPTEEVSLQQLSSMKCAFDEIAEKLRLSDDSKSALQRQLEEEHENVQTLAQQKNELEEKLRTYEKHVIENSSQTDPVKRGCCTIL
eukprot:ANDGO_02131.mRNA.1 Osmotic avoidance abnormal protein 3